MTAIAPVSRALAIERAEDLGRRYARDAAALSMARWNLTILEAAFNESLERLAAEGLANVADRVGRRARQEFKDLEQAAYAESCLGFDQAPGRSFGQEEAPCPRRADATGSTPGDGPCGGATPSSESASSAGRSSDPAARRSTANATA